MSVLQKATLQPFPGLSGAVLPFSKSNKFFFRYFDPENIFLDNENYMFFRVTGAIFLPKRK